MTLTRDDFLAAKRVFADYIQDEGPFDFIFSGERLRERSRSLMPQGRRKNKGNGLAPD